MALFLDGSQNGYTVIASGAHTVCWISPRAPNTVHAALPPDLPAGPRQPPPTATGPADSPDDRTQSRHISSFLSRPHLNRWRDPHPLPPVRYERPCPGDLLHVETKGMTLYQQVSIRGDGRPSRPSAIRGRQALHVAIDDHSRLAYSHDAISLYAQHGICSRSPAHRQWQLLSLPQGSPRLRTGVTGTARN